MKNIALILAVTLMMAACSSGSSVSDIPPDDISGSYNGDFVSNNELSEGNLTVNIQDNGGVLTGNIIVTFNPDESTCITNSSIEGTRTGFNVSFVTANVTFTLTLSSNASTLMGSYVPLADGGCSNGSGSGTITLTR